MKCILPFMVRVAGIFFSLIGTPLRSSQQGEDKKMAAATGQPKNSSKRNAARCFFAKMRLGCKRSKNSPPENADVDTTEENVIHYATYTGSSLGFSDNPLKVVNFSSRGRSRDLSFATIICVIQIIQFVTIWLILLFLGPVTVRSFRVTFSSPSQKWSPAELPGSPLTQVWLSLSGTAIRDIFPKPCFMKPRLFF